MVLLYPKGPKEGSVIGGRASGFMESPERQWHAGVRSRTAAGVERLDIRPLILLPAVLVRFGARHFGTLL
jgi:hypothetical protein